ncbi:hypothetical protein ABTZ57_20290 [Streptomyces sp. NPDC094048]|uniref:hypothetical protein n=1 Tax=unclassified Streptomyces TaxID=2593676 RepID=UPI00332DA58A
MNATPSCTEVRTADAEPADHERTDRNTRAASWIALCMLVPVLIGCGLFVLSTTRASGCVTYGVDCAHVPRGWIPGSFVAAIVLGIAAVAWPRRWLPFVRARSWLLVLHIVAQCMTALLILSYA